MQGLPENEPTAQAPDTARRSVLRGAAGLAAGVVAPVVLAPAAAAAAPDPSANSPQALASQAAAARVAAAQAPLLRRKQLRAFEVMDVDGDGYLTRADTVRLARKLAEAAGTGESSADLRKLLSTIDRIWNALVDKPRWVPDLERLDAEQYVIVMANSVATTPDKTLEYITVLTNLVFAMTGSEGDGDGVLGKGRFLAIGTTVLGVTPAEALVAWDALAPADPGGLTYAEVLIAFTDFVTSTDASAPGNLVLGRL